MSGVMGDPLQTIGQILTGDEQRDAIHIAVLPAVAGEQLRPGDAVAISHGTSNVAIRALDEYGLQRSIGVVDPFIGTRPKAKVAGGIYDSDDTPIWQIKKGQRFWIFLHPQSVTGMRHHWQHPAVDAPAAVPTEAERWLRDFAQQWGFEWDDLIAIASNPPDEMDYITAHGRDLHHASGLGGDLDLFWQNLAVFTGRTFDENHRNKVGWSCSC